MAPPRSLPALLVLLTLAAAFTPLAAGQGTSPQGAIVLSTGQPIYPPGESVLFTLQNRGTAATTLLDAKLEVYTNARIRATVPVGNVTLPASGAASFSWLALLDGAPAPSGTYFGLLKYEVLQTYQGYSWTTKQWAYVNGNSGWSVHASTPGNATPAGVLAAGAAKASFAPGEAVGFTLANVGTADLVAVSPCEIRVQVFPRGRGPAVHDSAVQGCAAVEQRLAVNGTWNLTWDQRTTDGGQAPPGEYNATVAFGNASANVSFLLTVPPTLPAGPRLGLAGPAGPQPPGTGLAFALSNSGDATLEGTLGVQVLDGSGTVVARPPTATVQQRLAVGANLTFTWDQQRNDGQPAGAGTYTVVATFGGLQANATVTLLGSSAPPPTAPPPTDPPPPPPSSPPVAPPPAAPPAAPPPTEPKPVVGNLEVNASAAGCYRGDWISFCVDAAARELRDFRADGRLIVEVLTIPGRGDVQVTTGAGLLRVRTDDVVLTLYDTSAGALRVEASNASLTVRLAQGVAARTTAEGAALDQGAGVQGVVVLSGEGRVTGGGSDLTVSLQPTKDQGTSSVVLRPAPPAAPPATPAPAPVVAARAALQAGLPRAIAEQRVAAEAYIAREGGDVATSVVPYIAAEVRVDVARATPRELSLTLDVSDHAGRTLVFHLGEGVLDARGDLEVLYDGQPLVQATDLEDVLNPDDDGLVAEYVLVEGAAGLQVILSVPHFSVHTLTVQSVAAEVARSLAPYGGLAAVALVTVATIVLFRRSRSP